MFKVNFKLMMTSLKALRANQRSDIMAIVVQTMRYNDRSRSYKDEIRSDEMTLNFLREHWYGYDML